MELRSEELGGEEGGSRARASRREEGRAGKGAEIGEWDPPPATAPLPSPDREEEGLALLLLLLLVLAPVGSSCSTGKWSSRLVKRDMVLLVSPPTLDACSTLAPILEVVSRGAKGARACGSCWRIVGRSRSGWKR